MTEMSLVYTIGKEMGLTEEEMAYVYRALANKAQNMYSPGDQAFTDSLEATRRQCRKALMKFRDGLEGYRE